MPNPPNCIIANAALCEVFSIWWRPILNCAIHRYRNFIEHQMIRFTVWHMVVHTFFRQVPARFGMTFAYFWFWIPRNKPKKDSTEASVCKASDCSWGVKGDQGTFTYPPTFFPPLVFENSSQSFIEYSTVTFGFDPFAFLPTGYCKRTRTIRFGLCSDTKKWLLN